MISRPRSDLPFCSAAVIAGGGASRMGGRAKPLLEIGGETILDRQLAVLRPRFATILVAVAGDAAPATPPGGTLAPFLERGLSVVVDHFPGSGPMAGLHAALLACPTPWLFAVACDMPFLDGDLIDRLAALAPDSGVDALVPLSREGPEPLHAFYRATTASAAATCLADGRRAMSDLLGAVRTRFLDEAALPGLSASRSLANLNTPLDLESAGGRLR